MTLFRTLLSGVVLALGLGPAAAQQAAPPMLTLQTPAPPNPVRVALNPKTTALLVLDMVGPICNAQPKCTGDMLPAATPFVARARQAGVTIAYGTLDRNMALWLPQVAPQPGDIKVTVTAQDRFYNTDLDQRLKAKGITTLILVGWKVSGSVTYTSVAATAHGYTVVVPVNTTASPTDFETAIGYYQILNQLSANVGNEPLKPKASTLSRTDLIAFQ